MNIIDLNNPVPKYLQISNWLKDQIKSGKYNEGDRLPSEAELTQMCEVSRATLRQAIANLADNGLLVKKKGLGTFVKSADTIVELKHNMKKISSFGDYIGTKQLKEKTVVLEKSAVIANDKIAQKLILGSQQKAIQIKRLRTGNNISYIYEESYLPFRLFQDILNYDLQGSLYKIITTKFGIKLKRSIQEIKAVILDKKVTTLFNMPKNSPGFFMKNLTFDENETPIELLYSYYRGDKYKLELELDEYQLP
jgi:GntR family transcriptional regulator